MKIAEQAKRLLLMRDGLVDEIDSHLSGNSVKAS
jgi:hypothetical protein